MALALAPALIVGAQMVAPTESAAATRALKLYNTHTKESATIVFRKNGRYVASGLKKLNHFLRDWRRNEATKMNPELFDLLWEVHRETGSKNAIYVVSGYRSPVTNAALRKRSRGVAKNSQHTKGNATDFYIPGVNLARLRKVAMKKQVGGVGYYPKSGSPFVHLDTASVRAWPRMTRKQLAGLFPDGKTLHIPSDGKPLKGYAAAEKLERSGRLERLNTGRGSAVASTRKPRRTQVAKAKPKPRRTEVASASPTPRTNGGGTGFLGGLFRGNSRQAAETPASASATASTPSATPETFTPPPIPTARPRTEPVLVAEAPDNAPLELAFALPAPRPAGAPQDISNSAAAFAGLPDAQPENAEEAARIAQAYASAAAGGDPLAEILRGGQPLSALRSPALRGQTNGGFRRAGIPVEMSAPLSSAPPRLTGTTSLASTGDTRFFRHPDQRQIAGGLSASAIMVVNRFGASALNPPVGAFKGRAIAPVAFLRVPGAARRSAALVAPVVVR